MQALFVTEIDFESHAILWIDCKQSSRRTELATSACTYALRTEPLGQVTTKYLKLYTGSLFFFTVSWYWYWKFKKTSVLNIEVADMWFRNKMEWVLMIENDSFGCITCQFWTSSENSAFYFKDKHNEQTKTIHPQTKQN